MWTFNRHEREVLSHMGRIGVEVGRWRQAGKISNATALRALGFAATQLDEEAVVGGNDTTFGIDDVTYDKAMDKLHAAAAPLVRRYLLGSE